MLFHACRTAEVPPAALSCLPHSFTFLSCPFAVGIAASIRVGHLVGAGEAVAARVSSIVTVLIILSRQPARRILLECGMTIAWVRREIGRSKGWAINPPVVVCVAACARGSSNIVVDCRLPAAETHLVDRTTARPVRSIGSIKTATHTRRKLRTSEGGKANRVRDTG